MSDWFELDHVALLIDPDSHRAFQDLGPEIDQQVPFAGTETTNTESGSWSHFYIARKGFYVELIATETPHRWPFVLYFRSRKFGALRSFQRHLDAGNISYIYETMRLTDGTEAMDWFQSVEIESGFPVFWIEYCDEYLRDIGTKIPKGNRHGIPINLYPRPSIATEIEVKMDSETISRSAEILGFTNKEAKTDHRIVIANEGIERLAFDVGGKSELKRILFGIDSSAVWSGSVRDRYEIDIGEGRFEMRDSH